MFPGFMLLLYPGPRLWLEPRCDRNGDRLKSHGDGTGDGVTAWRWNTQLLQGTGMIVQFIHERKIGNSILKSLVKGHELPKREIEN